MEVDDVQVEVEVDVDRYFGCLKGVSKSIQLPVLGIEAIMVLTSRIMKKANPDFCDLW